LDGLNFTDVAYLGASGMGIDIVNDINTTIFCLMNGFLHGKNRTFSVRLDNITAITTSAVGNKFYQDISTSLLSVF
jgi:hypothetical protein